MERQLKCLFLDHLLHTRCVTHPQFLSRFGLLSHFPPSRDSFLLAVCVISCLVSVGFITFLILLKRTPILTLSLCLPMHCNLSYNARIPS